MKPKSKNTKARGVKTHATSNSGAIPQKKSTSAFANSPALSLSAKEKGVLEFLESFVQLRGIAPSYQEIKDHFGFASFNSVQRYLKQLQIKKYIHLPGENQKRALLILRPAQALQSELSSLKPSSTPSSSPSQHPETLPTAMELGAVRSLALPLLGYVAAGQPIEAIEGQDVLEVPPHMVRNPHKSFLLKVSGSSMIEEGILDGDVIIVQKQAQANNGEIVVATVDNEATVKRFYLHSAATADPSVELRPANSSMDSFWYEPDKVEIRGIVVGLIRKF